MKNLNFLLMRLLNLWKKRMSLTRLNLLRHLSLLTAQVLIGEAMLIIRCFAVFTVSHFLRLQCLKIILICLKRLKSVTITNSAESLNFSQLLIISVRACLSFCQRVLRLSKSFKDLLRMRRQDVAGSLQKLLLWQRAIYIKFQVTGTIIKRVCSF